MKSLYIVFRTIQHSDANDIRRTLLVTDSIKTARKTILDDIKSMGEYGMFPNQYYDFIDGEHIEQAIVVDEEKTSHNGLVLKCTRPFMSIELNDSPDPQNWDTPSEWLMRWEIEEVKAPLSEDPYARLAEKLTKCERTENYPIEFSGEVIITQTVDGKGYLHINELIVRKIWVKDYIIYAELTSADAPDAKPMKVSLEDYDDLTNGERVTWDCRNLYRFEDSILPREKWNFLYEQKYPDSNGACYAGVISNGKDCLFFNICRDDDEPAEHCSVHSSITMEEETLLCQYPWTKENDELLLSTLNALPKDSPDFCGNKSVLRNINFSK